MRGRDWTTLKRQENEVPDLREEQDLRAESLLTLYFRPFSPSLNMYLMAGL